MVIINNYLQHEIRIRILFFYARRAVERVQTVEFYSLEKWENNDDEKVFSWLSWIASGGLFKKYNRMDYKEEMEESLFALPEKQIVKVGRTVADEYRERRSFESRLSVDFGVSPWL